MTIDGEKWKKKINLKTENEKKGKINDNKN